MRIIIFTAVFGVYRKVVNGFLNHWDLPRVYSPPEGWDLVYYLITDMATFETNPRLKHSSGWSIIFYEGEGSPRYKARRVKLLDYLELLPPHDLSIWIDSNVSMVPETCFHHFRRLPLDKPLWTLAHPARRCTYQEIEHCYQCGIGDPESFRFQRRLLEKEGFPSNLGLVETRILGRRPTETIRLFSEAWWTWFTLFPRHHLRDQCSFMPALWTCEMDPKKVQLEIEEIFTIFSIDKKMKARQEVPMKIRREVSYKRCPKR